MYGFRVGYPAECIDVGQVIELMPGMKLARRFVLREDGTLTRFRCIVSPLDPENTVLQVALHGDSGGMPGSQLAGFPTVSFKRDGDILDAEGLSYSCQPGVPYWIVITCVSSADMPVRFIEGVPSPFYLPDHYSAVWVGEWRRIDRYDGLLIFSNRSPYGLARSDYGATSVGREGGIGIKFTAPIRFQLTAVDAGVQSVRPWCAVVRVGTTQSFSAPANGTLAVFSPPVTISAGTTVELYFEPSEEVALGSIGIDVLADLPQLRLDMLGQKLLGDGFSLRKLRKDQSGDISTNPVQVPCISLIGDLV